MQHKYTPSTLADILAYASLQDIVCRFLKDLAIGDPDDCWLWQRAKINGYGSFYIKKLADGNNIYIKTHRLMYLLIHHYIPPNLHVLHRCENRYPLGDITCRSCCNPTHLYLGDGKRNMLDRIQSGRHNAQKGESHWSTLLTSQQVEEIRIRFAAGEKPAALAKEFNIARQNLVAIVHGQTWKHVGGPIISARKVTSTKDIAALVPTIRKLHRQGIMGKDIASEVGVAPMVVSRIIRGKAHASVPDEPDDNHGS
jgi:hypothetical protein